MGAIATVNAFVAAWSDHNLHAAIELTTEDCVFESTGPAPEGARLAGRDAVRAAWRPIVDDASARFEVEESFGRLRSGGPTLAVLLGRRPRSRRRPVHGPRRQGEPEAVLRQRLTGPD